MFPVVQAVHRWLYVLALVIVSPFFSYAIMQKERIGHLSLKQSDISFFRAEAAVEVFYEQ
jgi:hypothetical protein